MKVKGLNLLVPQIFILLFFAIHNTYAISQEEDLLRQGIIYYNKGMPEDALEQFNQAVKINTGFGEGFYWRGLVFYKAGDCDQAIYNYDKAIQYYFKTADVYYNRALAYVKKGKYEQALLDYNTALELKPDFAYAYESRADLYFSKKEYAKAWTDVEKAQALGYKVNPGFIRQLEKALGREK